MKLNIFNSETVMTEVISPEIILSGNTEAVLDGVKSIIEYNDSCLRVVMGKHTVKIIGEGIEVKNAVGERIILNGTILSLDFS